MSIKELIDKYTVGREIVDVSKLKISPNNIRSQDSINAKDIIELSRNINKWGLFQDIIVNKQYEILSGGLRWRAVQQLGWKKVPVKVIDTESIALELNKTVEEVESLLSASTDLFTHPVLRVDRGKLVKKLFEKGWTIPQIAEVTGASESKINNWLGITKAPSTLKKSEAQKFLELSSKKREKVNTILTATSIASKDEEHPKVLMYASKASLRDLEETAKEAGLGMPIDWDYRMSFVESIEPKELLEVRVPKHDLDVVRKTCRKYKLDFLIVVHKLFKWLAEDEQHLQVIGCNIQTD